MSDFNSKLKKIKLLLTDVDGVLTDTGVYYSSKGEEFKRFSIRDGMGVERLRKLAKIDTGIITGEKYMPVKERANKLKIEELHLGINNKLKVFKNICKSKNLKSEEIAFIGDDINDLEIIEFAGVSACPSDAMNFIKSKVDIILENKGGHGAFRAFREFAEIIIQAKL